MLASIFAWLCGICNRYSASYSSKEAAFRLSEIVYEKYQDKCATCHSRPCNCRPTLQKVFVCWPLSLSNAGQFLCEHISTLSSVVITQSEFTARANSFSELLAMLDCSEHADTYVALVDNSDTCGSLATALAAAHEKGPTNIFIAARKEIEGPDAPPWVLEQPLSVVSYADNAELLRNFDHWVTSRFKLAK